MEQMKSRKILIALGGNALEAPGTKGDYPSQLNAVREATVHIADLIEAGNQVVIAHGNGPQVGRILLQSEAGKNVTPPIPLDVCGAMTQGSIGYHIQNALTEELRKRGLDKQVVSLVTQVEVSLDDPAFSNFTKPIGPFYSEEEKNATVALHPDFIFIEDSGRGWRRVVASPQPKKVIEAEAAATLLEAGMVVVTAGGGGVPVVAEGQGYRGVEAVIDKDLSAALLAEQLNVDDLFILTAVPAIALHFGTPEQKFLHKVTSAEAEEYCKEGHFAPGSMLPKVEAAIKFVKNNPVRRGIITSLEKASEGFFGTDGTIIVK